ncbi:hypothetical protein DIQ65_10455 [Acinetobacter baumannii]|nr:hypothetical protein [Acinetobacter baumannii]MBQ4958269.1 hypothetical protein [Acinetobacter baumannii]MBQ4974189.1 hypothetical protein [Acinetobacter baumannii]MDR8287857.1 hypothetical protein [Acinetobacter baumannii]MUP73479.1 hypothetical protein [Acinetobacter baumannii]
MNKVYSHKYAHCTIWTHFSWLL